MPNTVARPATLGACQVRLQLSMLFEPITMRANFCAAKFISLVLFEQLKSPNACGPCASDHRAAVPPPRDRAPRPRSPDEAAPPRLIAHHRLGQSS